MKVIQFLRELYAFFFYGDLQLFVTLGNWGNSENLSNMFLLLREDQRLEAMKRIVSSVDRERFTELGGFFLANYDVLQQLSAENPETI